MSNPYARNIKGTPVDVYDILRAFGVADPAIQHAVKKLLRYGSGTKSLAQDVDEAQFALRRYLQEQPLDSSRNSSPAVGTFASGPLAGKIAQMEDIRHDY